MDNESDLLKWIIGLLVLLIPGAFKMGSVSEKNVSDKSKEKVMELEKQVQELETTTPAEQFDLIIKRLKRPEGLGKKFFVVKAAEKKYEEHYICLSCLIRQGMVTILDYEVRRFQDPNTRPQICYKKFYECKICKIKCQTQLSEYGAEND